jgi:hypothetical protein
MSSVTNTVTVVSASLDETNKMIKDVAQPGNQSPIDLESDKLAVQVAKERITAPILSAKVTELTKTVSTLEARREKWRVRFKEQERQAIQTRVEFEEETKQMVAENEQRELQFIKERDEIMRQCDEERIESARIAEIERKKEAEKHQAELAQIEHERKKDVDIHQAELDKIALEMKTERESNRVAEIERKKDADKHQAELAQIALEREKDVDLHRAELDQITLELKIKHYNTSLTIHDTERTKVAAEHRAELKQTAAKHETEREEMKRKSDAELEQTIAKYEAELKELKCQPDRKQEQETRLFAELERDAAVAKNCELIMRCSTMSQEMTKKDVEILTLHAEASDTAEQLAERERERELAAANGKDGLLLTLLAETEGKVAAALSSRVRYITDPLLPVLEANLLAAETELATVTRNHQLLEQQQHCGAFRHEGLKAELLQSQSELLELGVQHRLVNQQLEAEKEKVGQLLVKLDGAKEILQEATQGCEGHAGCTSCYRHLNVALRISRAFEQEAGRRLDAAWVDKMALLEQLAEWKSGLGSPPNSDSLAEETEDEEGPHPADSDSESESEVSEVQFVM